MSINKKVVAAISTAIGYYIQAEQEALALQQKMLAERPPQPYSSPYAMAGRAASMEARWMWQMRLAR